MPRDRYIWETSDRPTDPLGHENLTVSTGTATPNPPGGTRRIVLRTLGQPINYRDDGIAPSSGTGFPLLADETLVYDGDPSLLKLTLSSTATGDADVRLAYYG